MIKQYMALLFMINFVFLLPYVHGTREENRKKFTEHMMQLDTIPFATLINHIKELNTKIQCGPYKFESELSIWDFENKHETFTKDCWYSKHWNKFKYFYSKPSNQNHIFDNQCILSEIIKSNDTIKNTSELEEIEKIQLLFDWSIWLVHFYMGENSSRRWFFDQMRSLETVGEDGDLMIHYETALHAYDNDALTKKQLYAKLTMYITSSIIRSINIYRRCNPTIPVHSKFEETPVGPYIYRGIRAPTFDKYKSMFPTNFQSFSMSMVPGVNIVLDHYEYGHVKSQQFNTIIVVGDAHALVQKTAQPIQVFNAFISEVNGLFTGAPYDEQEVIFPPFCNFDIKELEFTDLNTNFHQELIISQLWHLNYLDESGNHAKFGQFLTMNVLWINHIDCLTQFEPLTALDDSTVDPDLEWTNDEKLLFNFPDNRRQKKKQEKSIYGRIQDFHTQFPIDVLPLYPCFRLFASHYNDVAFTGTITKPEEIEKIIIEAKTSQMYFASDKEIIDIELKADRYDPWGVEVDENTWEVIAVTHGEQANRVGIQIGWKIIKVDFIAKDNEKMKSIFTEKLGYYFTFEKPIEAKSFEQIVDEIWNNRSIWKNTPYQSLYIKLSYLSYSTILPSKGSCRFCMQWLTKVGQKEDYGKYSFVPICNAAPEKDADHNRFVCEFSDGTYSHHLFFPCQNKTDAKKVYGIFCRLIAN